MNNPILRNALVTFASFIFVITIVSAWTAPTQTAPNGNVAAPVTIGADQIKSGALGVAALVSLGGVQIGTTTALCTSGPAGTSGTVRWYKGAMEYCNGTAWVPFGGASETDPTVPANLKDGVSWSEISGTQIDTSPSGTWCGLAASGYSISLCKGHNLYYYGSCPAGYTYRTFAPSGDPMAPQWYMTCTKN